MKPPATIIIGEVVRLRERLNWYERLPLFGRRIVVTRDRSQAGDLADRLHALGAAVIELPAIAIGPPADREPLDRAIQNLESYDWLIFTSANGVRFFMERLDASRRDLRALRARLCAIGPATRRALEALHLKVDLMPAEYVAESLVAAFAEIDLAGRRVLLPRAAVARDVVPRELAKRGAQVDVVEAYRTVVPAGAADRAHGRFSAPAANRIGSRSPVHPPRRISSASPGAMRSTECGWRRSVRLPRPRCGRMASRSPSRRSRSRWTGWSRRSCPSNPGRSAGRDLRPGDLDALRLDSALEILQQFLVVPDLPRRPARRDGVRRRAARRFADVPFHRMQPVAAVGDVRHAEVLARRQQVLDPLAGCSAPSGIWKGRELMSM